MREREREGGRKVKESFKLKIAILISKIKKKKLEKNRRQSGESG